MDSQKRSQIVALTLVGLPFGAITLANAFPGQDMKRNLYGDRAACERDYSVAQCQPRSGGGSGGLVNVWYGPEYNANRGTAEARGDPGPGRTGREVARSEISTRGGFGSFGRAMRAVG